MQNYSTFNFEGTLGMLQNFEDHHVVYNNLLILFGAGPIVQSINGSNIEQIYEEDMQDRVEMCRILIPMLEDSKIQENVFFSDEATFYSSAFVNKHNIRYRCETNPHATVETIMNSQKLNIWCALSKNRLIGPFFFDDEIVDGENYLAMLQSFFIPEVRRLKKGRSIIFQQDGAPPHFAAT